MLEVEDLYVYYGSVKAVEGASFRINTGETVAMIGPNGAGKSTALKAIFGMVPINSGKILFNGKDITALRPDEHVSRGISLIPEGRRLFPSMTVVENLKMGAFLQKHGNHKTDIDKIFILFPSLKDKAKQKAGALSTGEQQMLAMGRALMQKPKLLLADEPSLGLSPSYTEAIFDKLEEINKAGTSILLVEQNATMALEIAHRGYVLKAGKIFFEDSGWTLLENEEVKRAFL